MIWKQGSKGAHKHICLDRAHQVPQIDRYQVDMFSDLIQTP
jgi:hypothetical protein